MNAVKSALNVSFLVALLLVLGQGQTALAQPDSILISYQGYLTDASGNPLTGSYTQAFKVRAWWDPEDQVLWSETHPSVPVNNGFFSVILGSHTPIPDSIFTGDDRYLFIGIDGDEEMAPPVLLTSVPGAVVSRRVVGDIRTDVGELVVTNPVVNPGQVKVKVVDDEAGVDIFGNIDSFEMAGNLYITADPDEAGLLMTHGSHDDPFGVELIARAGMNVVQIHPPDPCVPPDSCEPALEMVAEPDNHIFRVHPPEPCEPPEPCDPAFEVEATDSSTTVAVKAPSGDATEPAAVETYMKVKDFSVENEIKVNVFGEEPVNVLSMGTSLVDSSTHMIVKAPDGEATIEVNADPMNAQLTLLNGDPAGPADVVMRALPDGGGQIGINTDNPQEALDVNGTTKTIGFKMPTDAADGHVLTSDAEGNGTWQALKGLVGHAENVNTTTDGSGNVNVTYPGGLFSAVPSLSVTAQFNSAGLAQMGWVTVSNHTAIGFTLNVKDGRGSNWLSSAVQISYTAIGN
ncbi:MAG: hypothetical protein JSU65_11370 [Candidatus Zixiibacteriota bacterium]|nr:MAG: hypothetical protein JSU65_11370 [candidate division Zixibacteria bacterium]